MIAEQTINDAQALKALLEYYPPAASIARCRNAARPLHRQRARRGESARARKGAAAARAQSARGKSPRRRVDLSRGGGSRGRKHRVVSENAGGIARGAGGVRGLRAALQRQAFSVFQRRAGRVDGAGLCAGRGRGARRRAVFRRRGASARRDDGGDGRESGNRVLRLFSPWRPAGGQKLAPHVAAALAPFARRHIELARPKALLLLGDETTKIFWRPTAGAKSLRTPFRCAIWRGERRGLSGAGLGAMLRTNALKRAAWRALRAIMRVYAR